MAASSVVFSAVAGPDCDNGRFQKNGYFTNGKKGWTSSSGGYSGSGCGGSYLSVPMSGDSHDKGNSVNWLFDTSANAKQCGISVYIPRNSSLQKVGGDPSYYTVYKYFTPKSSNQIGSFSIRQVDNQGGWYNVPGTFPVTNQKLAVQLHDQGYDWHGDTSTYAHHAASALKVSCTS